MKAQHHALTGGIAASLLIPVLGFNSAVFWAASVLIDGDHYLDYLFRNRFKNFSIKQMFVFHSRLSALGKEGSLLGLNIGHTVEWLLLVYAGTAITGWFWLKAALWGMMFHILVDLLYLFQQRRITHRALSVAEYFIRWNLMKWQGRHPELPYISALGALPGFSEEKMGKSKSEN